MSLSPAQQGKYRPLVARAWQAHCLRTNQNPDVDSAHETWYRLQLIDACGIYTTKEANQTADFDALMAHFATLAGDTDWATRAAEGNERRLRYMIARETKRGNLSEEYVVGIARNMGFFPDLAELPADHLRRIWIALKNHNRRHADPDASRAPSSRSPRSRRVPVEMPF